LPQPIGSEEFWQAYKAALAATAADVGAVGADLRSKPGSVSAALASYYTSHQWKTDLAANTQAARRAILEGFRDRYGQWPLRQLTANFLGAYLDTLKPHAARNHLKALRGLLRHAQHDVTREVTPPKASKNKHASWPPEVIAQFEAHHPVGTKARLAFALARYTGAGRSELVRIGPQHIVDGVIVIARQKTGVVATITVHPELRAVIEATPLTGLSTFLISRFGKPYSPNGLSDEFREWCDQAGLPRKYKLHGLRNTMGKTLAEHGCNPHEIGSVLAHSDIRSALHYSTDIERKAMAQKAMARWIAGPNQQHSGNDHVSVDSPPQTHRGKKT
jgi:integrase